MQTDNDTPIRILVAEDSPVARELLVSIFQDTPGLQVIGTARNGAEAVRLAERLKPDIITMDVYMPEMDGLEATRQIMAQTPLPIVMITASLDKRERDLTFTALQAGALSVMQKPSMYDPPNVLEQLTHQIKIMSEVKVVRRWNRTAKKAEESQTSAKTPAGMQSSNTKTQLVAVAASTGGPGILSEILSKLPGDFSVPILIVQHITNGFGQGLADWLNQQTTLDVTIAKEGVQPKAGQVLIAPDDYHMVINSLEVVSLNKEAPCQGLRPAADYLFASAARVYGHKAIGVILSGMGSDGAAGLLEMYKTGAHTIAQDQESCVVFGMPAVAIDLGAAQQVLPASQIATAITALV